MAWMGGVTAASASAAALHMQQQEEEEDLTRYTPEELAGDWEFKIVRCMGSAFGSREKLKALLKEESLAGWIMVEKFDDQRVRFKRPASARRQDHLLPADIDPYRTELGMSGAVMAAVILGVVALVMALVIVLVMVVAG